MLIDKDADLVEAAAASIRKCGGPAGDVTDEARIGEIMADVAKGLGGIDLLINKASLHSDDYSKPIATMGAAKIRRLFDVKVISTVIATFARISLRWFVRERPSSTFPLRRLVWDASPIGTSKLAVAGLTITFAREFALDGIRVNAISPGLVLTDTIRDELPEEKKTRVKAMQFS